MDLFKPDVFSVSRPAFSPASTSDQASVSGLVRAAYSCIGSPLAVAKCGGQEINSHNFRIETDRGIYAIKRLVATEAKAAQLTAQAHLSEQLRAEGVPMAPFERAGDGALVVYVDGIAWSAQRFVSGSYFAGSADECVSVAAVLARLDDRCQARPEVAAEVDPTPLVNLDPSHAAWTGLTEPESVSSLSVAIAELLRRQREFILSWREALSVRIDTAEPHGLCHIDIHPHNLLSDGAEIVAVLDFESLKPARRRLLTAYGCYKLLRQAAVHAGPGHREALAAFRDQLRLDQLLSAREPRAHALLAAAEIMRRLCAVLELNVTKGDSSWNHMIEVMIRALHEVPIAFGGPT